MRFARQLILDQRGLKAERAHQGQQVDHRISESHDPEIRWEQQPGEHE